jgi:hypothetical protein
MRLGLAAAAAAAAAALLCACQLHLYDPLDELEYRVYPDAASAVRGILDGVPAPRVYAVGEYHPIRGAAVQRTPIARFTDEIIELLEPRAQHLVIEAWAGDGCGGERGDGVSAQVARAIGRPAGAGSDLARLVDAGRRASLVAHALPITCIEQSAMLDARGRVDFLRLLEMITAKLYETARALAVDQGRSVIVYGGALHNDLYPRYALEELTYAPALARDLGAGGVLEIDLVVPEIVAPLPMVRAEPWFPLLGLASPARAIVWERGPDSYVVMLPAQTEGIGRFARPPYARR